MMRERLSNDPLVTSVLGAILYLVIWLVVLPFIADTSARAAVLTLTAYTGLYCYAIADLKGLNAPMWATIGVLTGFFELGILPVVILGLLRSSHLQVDNPV